MHTAATVTGSDGDSVGVSEVLVTADGVSSVRAYRQKESEVECGQRYRNLTHSFSSRL